MYVYVHVHVHLYISGSTLVIASFFVKTEGQQIEDVFKIVRTETEERLPIMKFASSRD